ncbi:MAG TPA: minor capsid protein [Phytomonospora sp.]
MTRSDVREIVADRLAAAGEATVSESLDGTEPWPVHWRKMPALPDEAIVIACYGLGGDYELGVQVRVRGSRDSTTSAEDKAQAIKDVLHGLANQTRGDTTLVLLTHTSTADLGSDANGRDELAVNFRAVTNDPNTALDF